MVSAQGQDSKGVAWDIWGGTDRTGCGEGQCMGQSSEYNGGRLDTPGQKLEARLTAHFLLSENLHYAGKCKIHKGQLNAVGPMMISESHVGHGFPPGQCPGLQLKVVKVTPLWLRHNPVENKPEIWLGSLSLLCAGSAFSTLAIP